MRPDTTIYAGWRRQSDCLVTRDDEPLAILESLQLRTHSEEFNWGYGGSGPAQLALAILVDFVGGGTGFVRSGRRAIAESLHDLFAREVIARLEHDRWVMTGAVDSSMGDAGTSNEKLRARVLRPAITLWVKSM